MPPRRRLAISLILESALVEPSHVRGTEAMDSRHVQGKPNSTCGSLILADLLASHPASPAAPTNRPTPSGILVGLSFDASKTRNLVLRDYVRNSRGSAGGASYWSPAGSGCHCHVQGWFIDAVNRCTSPAGYIGRRQGLISHPIRLTTRSRRVDPPVGQWAVG